MHGLILSLLMTFSANLSAPAPIHEGGLCVGLGWVALRPGEKAYIDRGIDFDVFHFQDEKDVYRKYAWNVYDGFFLGASVSGYILKSTRNVDIHRASDGAEEGYIAVRGGLQNFFYGPAFKGTTQDKRFFDRVDFSARGRSLCEKYRN